MIILHILIFYEERRKKKEEDCISHAGMGMIRQEGERVIDRTAWNDPYSA